MGISSNPPTIFARLCLLFRMGDYAAEKEQDITAPPMRYHGPDTLLVRAADSGTNYVPIKICTSMDFWRGY
jgi:hypothetical protein